MVASDGEAGKTHEVSFERVSEKSVIFPRKWATAKPAKLTR